MGGAEFAALDTLQHCLPGDAEGRGGDLDGYPAGGGIVGDELPDGLGEADAPGGPGGDLLAGDESVVEPPVEGGGGDAEFGGGLVHAHHLTVGVWDIPALAGGNAVALADAGHVNGSERHSGGGAALLLVEDFRDHRVVVVDRQPADQ